VGRDRFPVHAAELDLAFEVTDDGGADVDVVELVDVGDAAGREHVDLEDLVADQIDTHEVEAVRHQPWTEQVADALLRVREVRAPPRAADVHVVANVVFGTHAFVRRHRGSDSQRRAAEQQHSFVAFGDRGQVLLDDHVAFSPYGRDHLLDVHALATRDVEHVLPAETGQRFDDRGAVQLAQERAYTFQRAGDHGLRTQLDRETGEVHLRTRPRQPVRIVHHQHAELLEAAAEVERRVEGVAVRGAGVGVVAQEDDVEVDHPRVLARRVRAGQRFRVRRGVP
jgi:hypothetical protein